MKGLGKSHAIQFAQYLKKKEMEQNESAPNDSPFSKKYLNVVPSPV